MSGVALIWAQSTSGVIGRAGDIPWDLPEDQARFKELTLGRPVVMGRLTWESLPASVRPLPGRDNIVITRAAGYAAPGARVVGTVEEALADDSDGQTWVIGGGQIYAAALPRATRCEVTEIAVDLPAQPGDALAPPLDAGWTRTSGQWLTSRSGLRYRFHSYRR